MIVKEFYGKTHAIGVMEALTDTYTPGTAASSKWMFEQLPAFASFLKNNCVEEYVMETLRLTKEVNLPMMKYLASISDEDLFKMSIASTGEFLAAVETNKLQEHVERSLRKWMDDDFGIIKRDEISAEDILLAGFLRKKTMTKFLPSYTTDVLKAIEIIKEIDDFTKESDLAFSNVYIKLLKDRISEQARFTEIVSNTTPGLNYIFNLTDRTVKYINKNFTTFFGYDMEGMREMGNMAMQNLIYAGDLSVTAAELEKFATATDGEVIAWELRLKAENGNYVWMKNYSSVFKRDASGTPVEIVGIILDVSTEKDVAEKLLLRESQLLDAQAQAQVGSYELDVVTGKMEVTPQFRAIYELSDFDLYKLIDHVHPADRERVNNNREKAIAEGTLYDNEYRYLINGKEKIIRSRGIASIKNGRKILTGTAQDVTERYKIVQKLIESEDQSRKAQELAHVGNWKWDLNTGICTWSEELFRIYEMDIPEGELIRPADAPTYHHPNDKHLLTEARRILFEENKPHSYMFRILLPSGNIKYLNVIADVTFDEDHKATTLFGSVQDITEKQLLIEQLQQSDDLFKQAQARTHIGNWTWDIVADKVTWSDEMFRVYGLEPQSEEVNYETYISHIHPDDKEERIKQVAKVLETGTEEDNHYRIIRPDGSITILHTKSELQRDENGRPIRMTGTCQDVTDKQSLIEQLQKSDELYKQAQAISHIGNWVWDMNSKEVNWSDEMYRIYELELQSMKNTADLDKFNHPDDTAFIRNSIQAAVETGQPFDFNYRILFPDGRMKTVHARGESKILRGGSVMVYGTLQDITQQEAIEQALYRKNLQLQQSNTSLEEYAYVASHDLKEPLRKIATFSDRILTTQSNSLNEDGQLYLNKIIDASKRMQKMIIDLLSVSTILGNNAYEDCDLKFILEEALVPLEYKIEESKAIIEADELPHISGVPSQFRQLFQNLISNSLKFARAGTAPHIKITHKYLGQKAVEPYKLAKAKKYLQIQLEDNGIGFANEYAAKIFAIFQRLHGKSEYEGTGIGLAICKKIIENHSGVIIAEGVQDQGAVFTMIIPV